MDISLSPEQSLLKIHSESKADQSALYYLDANYSSLLLCSTSGQEHLPKRYWRSYCSDTEILCSIRNSRCAFILEGSSITGGQEEIVAVPILSGDNVFGLIVHSYMDNAPDNLQSLMDVVQDFTGDLFSGLIEFLVAEQSRPLPALLHIAGEISSSLDLDRVLLNVVEQGTVLFRAKMSSLMLVNKKRKALEMVTAYGCSLDYLDKPNLPLDGAILGTVVRENRILQVLDVFDEPLYLHKEHARREGVCSLLAAPISFKNEVLGVLNIYSAAPRRWQRSEMELLQTFADHAAIAITNVRVHEQNMDMEERLQESAKRATLGELAAGLAHEIRNPLAVINMLIHSWKSSPPVEDDFHQDVDVIAQKISDLNSLVSDLLSLAKTRPLERRQINIEELIERVLRLLKHRINKQRVTIKKKILTRNTSIPIDRERIEQAMLNLLLNALDVVPEESVICIELYENDGMLALDFVDCGPGIPADMVKDIFKAFRSTKPEGVGLGLPMTLRIVEEHQGALRVTKNGSNGATFTMTLPYSITE